MSEATSSTSSESVATSALAKARKISTKHVHDAYIDFDKVPVFAGQKLRGSVHFTLKVSVHLFTSRL